jgi:hypothetical protein
MTRSVIFQAEDVMAAHRFKNDMQARLPELQRITETTSRFARLIDLHFQLVGNLVYSGLRGLRGWAEASRPGARLVACDGALPAAVRGQSGGSAANGGITWFVLPPFQDGLRYNERSIGPARRPSAGAMLGR